MSMFYPMERDDSAAPLSIIEEGDEHDLGAEAFADMAMGGMDMSLELNSLQIRAFLARNEAQSENSGAFTSVAQREEPHSRRKSSNNSSSNNSSNNSSNILR